MMSNIYDYCIQFLEKYIYSFFDTSIYPFEFMDGMYSSDFDFETDILKKEEKKKNIMQKISDFTFINGVE